MTKERIQIFVDGNPVKIYRGMTVKHVLLSLDQALYKEAQEGEMVIEDENGFTVGLEGALYDNARLYVRKSKAKVQEE